MQQDKTTENYLSREQGKGCFYNTEAIESSL